MRLLLDTHIWLWSLLEPDRLARTVRRELRNPTSELWLSPISVWELSVLVRRERVRLGLGLAEWLEAAFERAPLREAPLTHEVAAATHLIDLPHRDPADRFLAATASVYELRLVTADERLIRSRKVATLSNR